MSEPNNAEYDSGHALVAELLGWSVDQVEETGAQLRAHFTDDLLSSYTEEGEG